MPVIAAAAAAATAAVIALTTATAGCNNEQCPPGGQRCEGMGADADTLESKLLNYDNQETRLCEQLPETQQS